MIAVVRPVLFCVLALGCLNGYASTACDKPRNDFDGLYCLNKVYQQADRELNDAYQALVRELDAAGKTALKKSQLTWIHTRNDECSKREDTAFYVDLACATRTTVQRLRFLQDRMRECVSTGCHDSKL